LPLDFFSQYVSSVKSLTTDDIARAAEQYLKPDHLKIVVVGPADKLERELVGLGIGPVERRTTSGVLVGHMAKFRD
jgi:hypothetical protein